MRTVLLILLLVVLVSGCAGSTSGTPTLEVPQAVPSPTTPVTETSAAPIPPSEQPAATAPLDPTVTQTLAEVPPTLPADVTRFPNPDQFIWQPFYSGFNRPVGITSAGDGSNRLFVIEQAGVIYVILEGETTAQPFLDIRDRVNSSANEQGLLGLAFHPQYANNGYFYVNYTADSGSTIIARFQVSQVDPNQADPTSEVELLRIDQPYGNHNGGMVAFGPDGYLYLGLGDGGSAGDPQNNAQSLDTLLGKILRIDVNAADAAYLIPEDNPYPDSARPEIWAVGLRNPWRFSFDRLTGDLYIGDVGQNMWEEISYLPSGSPGGANLGWKFYEASQPYTGTPPQAQQFIAPVAEYGHDQGCSVTGGVVYRGAELPEMQGVYLYGDYCSGRVWGLLQNESGGWDSQVLFENLGRIVSFGESEMGDIFLVAHEGTIFKLDRK